MAARFGFNAELEAMTTSLIYMGALASEAVAKAMEALQAGNASLAQAVIDGDRKIDEMERAIEHRCLTLLLRQQPVAGDLRKISAAIKMITDIERVGDAAADIAEISLFGCVQKAPQFLPEIVAMAQHAQCMVEEAIQAFVKENLMLAADVIARDDVVDNAFNAIKASLAQSIAHAEPELVDAVVDDLMIIKYLERVGDHAVNLCEWVEFNKTGMHKNEKIL